ncbi:MAG: MBL fold metallo-hydrolase [Methanocellales archaeon]|nr:MBL fold metallo-hydrolase [Methanocellales archaeon]
MTKSIFPSKLQVETLVVGPLFSNCFIVWDEKAKQGVIIDPGDDADVILKTIKNLGIEIKYILVTHGHFDHVGAVAPLKKELKVDFLAHKEDFFFIEDSEKSANRWGVDIEKAPTPDKYIEDGDKIRVGSFDLGVLHTPGHSPGGVSFVNDSMVFCGDTLFQGNIGRTDFRKGSFEELAKSIRTQLYTLPDDTIVYTGHGPFTTIGDEKKYNAFVRA